MSWPKLIYRAYRHPSLDPEGFIARWRQHGALGMAQPRWQNIVRYVQADVLPFDHPRVHAACDGVALVWYQSEMHRLAHIADAESGSILKRDERETFDRPVAEAAMLTEEQVYRDGVARFVLFVFWRENGVDTGDMALPDDIVRHAISRRRFDSPQTGLSYFAIEELGAGTSDALREIASRYDAAPVDLVLTEAYLLHDGLTSSR